MRQIGGGALRCRGRLRARPRAGFKATDSARDSMLVGYARTSTLDQEAGLEAQIRDLTAAGCEEIYQEQVSSVSARPQLDAAIKFARRGDTFVVTKLDRLARSVSHLLQIVEELK